MLAAEAIAIGDLHEPAEVCGGRAEMWVLFGRFEVYSSTRWTEYKQEETIDRGAIYSLVAVGLEERSIARCVLGNRDCGHYRLTRVLS